MKSYEKLNRKNKIESLLFALFGVCSIVSTYLFEPIGQKQLVISLGWAATGVGILMFLMYTFGKNNKRMKDTTIAENDEMSSQMKGNAARKSFMPTYIFLMISIIVVQYVNISVTNYILILLAVFPGIYVINIFRVSLKY
ncbi:hypothetical protein [Oceanirhabdus sp. W0125-5]|uniref:hypothetical protein n=1 Tax=Oceanirhabdus sp. W0125-5 TaxID=2999116 RepID=UPI0022F3280A|nr:hypothetical protein [Oceanirhabdus sp. W0125-5]WBW98245.1 hypothetical protein OW730_05615 [Oceanirhabdus sp. W0125-5]